MRPLSDDEDLARELVARASCLHERLGAEFRPRSTPRDLLDHRLGRWVEAVGNGQRERLERRLAWDNMSLAQVQERLGHVTLSPEAELPPWGRFLSQILATYGERDAGDRDAREGIRRDHPLPFEEILAPIVTLASAELTRTAERSLALLSLDAFQALQFDLLRSLSACAAATLNVEFSAFKSMRRLAFGTSGISWDKASTQHYRAFVQKLTGAPMVDLLQEYPVLGRWLASVATDWIDATRTFLSRLQADWPLLEAAYGRADPLTRVQALRAGLSDPHAGRQTVMRLTFTNGASIVYKPKDISLEAAFAALLDWCKARAPGFPLAGYRMIARDGYGWGEWLDASPPAHPLEAARYYEACGTLLAAIVVLNGADCHHENLVPQGRYPVLIDAETLLLPFWGALDTRLAGQDLQAWLEHACVLNTAMLPTWQSAVDGTPLDISGIGAGLELLQSHRRLRWQYINTDAMVFDWEETPRDSESPISHPAWAHREAVIEGFASGYRLLLSHRAALLAGDGPLQAFRNRPARFVPRHTYLYDTLLQQFRHPSRLSDGIEISLALETLCRPFTGIEDKPKEWALIAGEQRALARLDVPRFAVTTTSRSLRGDDAAELPDFLGASGWQVLRLRIESLGERDLAYQTSIIRQALQRPAGSAAVVGRAPRIRPARAGLLEAARRIGDRILETSVPCPSGGTTWLTMAPSEERQATELSRMSSGLFTGAGGTALFLGALAKLGQGAGLEAAAHRAVKPMLRAIANQTQFEGSLSPTGCGLSEGWASWCYTLVTLGDMLARPALLDWAELAASHLTPELIARDRKFDLLSGSAGALMALLRLYQVRPSDGLLQQAMACAEHLLSRRVPVDSGHLAWETLAGSKPLTGFSHGAAGIGYALACLYGTTQHPRYREAARAAFAYERSLFVPEAGNWPDFRARRHPERTVYACSWCNGAPGIVLSRIGSQAWLDDEITAAEIEAGLETTMAEGSEGLSLCCGLFGRIEALWCAGLAQHRPDWQEAAVTRAMGALPAIEAMIDAPQRMLPAPFFQGLAGIGYQLLRLAEPGQLPSILLFEAASVPPPAASPPGVGESCRLSLRPS